MQAWFKLLAARYQNGAPNASDISIFIAASNDSYKTFKRSRELHRHKHPIITKEEIIANTPEAELMTPEQMIAAAAKLIIK